MILMNKNCSNNLIIQINLKKTILIFQQFHSFNNFIIFILIYILQFQNDNQRRRKKEKKLELE